MSILFNMALIVNNTTVHLKMCRKSKSHVNIFATVKTEKNNKNKISNINYIPRGKNSLSILL